MIMDDPIHYFLGVSGTTDALRLLGLSPGRLDAAMIETALERQLAMVYQHPEGRSDEAERVRQRLRAAAAELRKSVSGGRLGFAVPATVRSRPPGAVRPWKMPRFRLTPFDRQVLAVLVGLGGWNARSRARLVALAGAYGVSVQGLMRVLTGLADYARHGGPRLGVGEITAGEVMTPPSADASIDEAPVTPALLDRLAERLSAELRREGRWPVIRLSMIFGSITLVLSIIGMWWLLTTSRPPAPKLSSVRTVPVGPTTAPRAGLTPPSPATQPATPRVLTFRQPPTFLGNGLPVQAAAAADQINEHLTSLDDVVRKLTVSADVSEAVYRSWEATIQSIATGWPLIDASALRQADQKIDEALSIASSTPPVLDRLMGSLSPPMPHRPAEPVGVWRSAWLAGTLGRLGGSTTLPPVVIEQARRRLEVVFGPADAQTATGFVESAGLWLERLTDPLVAGINLDDRTYDEWELWIAAQRLLGSGHRHQAAVMRAIRLVLESSHDLSQPGATQNVLGRLISMAMDDPSESVRDAALAIFDDETVTIHDLWVFTSLLAADRRAIWVNDQLVIPSDADELHRGRVRDALARAWPEPTVASEDAAKGQIVVVDAALGQRWLAALDASQAKKMAPSPENLAQQLVTTSLLIEAIDEMVARNDVRAAELLTTIEESLKDRSDVPPAPTRRAYLRPGQAIGMDGQWTAEYGDIGRSNEDRLQSLRTLRANAGTDLGPIDAETLVREAIRGSTMDIRSLAMAIIAEQLSTGPNVAMELLDQFADARPTEPLSDTIQRLSGRELPPARSPQWISAARLALVDHVLDLRDGARRELDQSAAALTDSYTRRLAAIQREPSALVAPDDPAEAAQLLAQAWLERAGVTLASNPVPADVGGIQQRLAIRLKLAEGPIQRFVAHQLGILDLLAYITVAEQPALREPVLSLLHDSARRRMAMHDILEQSLDVERTIASLWKLRIGAARLSPVSAAPVKEASS
jgi:hypothetical protein